MKPLTPLFLLSVFIYYLPGTLIGQSSTFLERYAHSIELSDTTDYRDLQVLDTLLQDKRFVLLGEFTHGAREINLVKNRLIRYLHAELGYEVLLLESGIGEVAVMNQNKEAWTPAELLSAGLTGPWRTAEYEDLMRYVQQSDLELAGFDPQRSGTAIAPYLEAVLLPVDSALAARAVQAENTFGSLTGRMRKNEFSTLMMQEKLNLVKRYESLLLDLEKYDRRLEKTGVDRQQQALIRRTLQNRIAFLDYFLQFKMDTDYRKRWTARDSLLAANIAWLAETVFPEEKFIISAHNFHVAKANDKERVMGEILSEQFGDQLYSIGLFARRRRAGPQIRHRPTGGDARPPAHPRRPPPRRRLAAPTPHRQRQLSRPGRKQYPRARPGLRRTAAAGPRLAAGKVRARQSAFMPDLLPGYRKLSADDQIVSYHL